MDDMSRDMEILRKNKKYIEGKNEQGQQHMKKQGISTAKWKLLRQKKTRTKKYILRNNSLDGIKANWT